MFSMTRNDPRWQMIPEFYFNIYNRIKNHKKTYHKVSYIVLLKQHCIKYRLSSCKYAIEVYLKIAAWYLKNKGQDIIIFLLLKYFYAWLEFQCHEHISTYEVVSSGVWLILSKLSFFFNKTRYCLILNCFLILYNSRNKSLFLKAFQKFLFIQKRQIRTKSFEQ